MIKKPIPLKGFVPLAPQPRNQTCNCGSGRKFKKCCYFSQTYSLYHSMPCARKNKTPQTFSPKTQQPDQLPNSWRDGSRKLSVHRYHSRLTRTLAAVLIAILLMLLCVPILLTPLYDLTLWLLAALCKVMGV